MSRAAVELDFFGMEKEASSKSQFQKFLDRRRSFRGVKDTISKIHPEMIKSVIASNYANQIGDNGSRCRTPAKSVSVPASPKEHQPQLPVLPVHVPVSRPNTEKIPETAPLTIFYNGTVATFDVPRDKAESIIKLAVEAGDKKADPAELKHLSPLSTKRSLLQNLNGDLPIARHKSLQRFLEKRKERLTMASPYTPTA